MRIIGIFVGAVIAVLILSLPTAWVVMLLLGVAHSLNPAVPALGFWLTWVLTLALRFAVAGSSS